MRRLCREDLFFLLTIGCKRPDLNVDWLYNRCREVEADPDGCLDLWAREHYKSTIITFGKTIQDVLASHGDDPLPRWQGSVVTVGIFSHTRPIAKGFLDQIKMEFENNTFLKSLFPDVLYEEPRRQAPKWGLDAGLIVKRDANPREATIEAWGVVDGQPTGKHFYILVYDDIVTLENVTTPEQITRTTNALKTSFNLGSRGGPKRFIGTRYHFNDTYRELIENETAFPRIHKATKNGKSDGEPVLLTVEQNREKRKEMGPYIYACQMLMDPKEDSVMGFKEEWLMYYDQARNVGNWNFYLYCDPANEKKKDNDFTVMLVLGLGPDNNIYLVNGLRDRLGLTQRAAALFNFHRAYRPLGVGYEKYGKDADIEHIEYQMEHLNYRFLITPLGGGMAKNDRIRRLVPYFEQRRIWLPHTLKYKTVTNQINDLVTELKSEYTHFPVAVHDDVMDCLARVTDKDLPVQFPELIHNLPVPSVTLPHESATRAKTEYDVFA